MVGITGSSYGHTGSLPATHNVVHIDIVPTARLPAHLEQLQQEGQEHKQLFTPNVILTLRLLKNTLIKKIGKQVGGLR